MSSPPNMPPQPGVPKKTSPLVWILAGVGGFIVLCMIGCAAIGFFFVHKVKEAGFDADLMKRNPGLAMTKMITAFNPNVEVVQTNEGKGTVTVRDKQTGKTITYKFDPDKQTMVITGDNGEQVSFGAGAGNKLPSWVPSYPGAAVQGTYSVQSSEGNSGTFSFTTSDSVTKVTDFYKNELRAAGFKVTAVNSSDDASMVQGESADSKDNIVVTLGASQGTTTVSIAVTEKQ